MSKPKPSASSEGSPRKKGKDFEPDTTGIAKTVDPPKPPTAFNRHASSDAPPQRKGGQSER